MKVRDLTNEAFRERLRGGNLLLEVGVFRFLLRSALGNVAATLQTFYRDFPLFDAKEFADFQLATTRSYGLFGRIRPGMSLLAEGRFQFERFAVSIAPVMLEWSMNRCVFSSAHRYLILHAATVSKNGRAVMIVGASGAGKSTLCTGLVAAGWRLLSDEFALMDLTANRLYATPRPISLKNESIDVVSAHAPHLELGPRFLETPKGTIAHVVPPLESIRSASEAATPALFVFPGFKAGEALAVEAVSPAKTMIQVIQSGFNFAALQQAAFDHLGDLVEQCPGIHLRYSDLDAAVGAIEAHLPA